MLTKSERKKICRVMDCKKLSMDACMHAAQNDRLPLRVVVQCHLVKAEVCKMSTGTNVLSAAAAGTCAAILTQLARFIRSVKLRRQGRQRRQWRRCRQSSQKCRA
uniref:NPH3 domain-containing protein n=1 Tax=Physcomitrium patens TaxID=3218 RepID=A0A2K1LA40_PHYPA|nr:hypothetical protein PHYPA_001327 [Physcomitrium patens]